MKESRHQGVAEGCEHVDVRPGLEDHAERLGCARIDGLDCVGEAVATLVAVPEAETLLGTSRYPGVRDSQSRGTFPDREASTAVELGTPTSVEPACPGEHVVMQSATSVAAVRVDTQAQRHRVCSCCRPGALPDSDFKQAGPAARDR